MSLTLPNFVTITAVKLHEVYVSAVIILTCRVSQGLKVGWMVGRVKWLKTAGVGFPIPRTDTEVSFSGGVF